MFHPAVRIEQQPWEEYCEIFNQLLKPDGYELYEKSHISGRSVFGWREILNKNVVIEKQAESLVTKFNSDYIFKQISVMNSTIESEPDEAIGKAKELLESCCKTILLEMGTAPEPAWDSIKLAKETCKILKLTPDDIDNEKKASDTIKKILGNLSVISQGMAELRNEYGSGHGKEAKFKGLKPKHARLAVGSAVTVVHFLWETLEENRKQGI